MTTATSRRGRPRDPLIRDMVRQFKSLPIDSSFFIPNAGRKQVEYLRKPVTTAGVGIEIAEVELDEIYQSPGVRIYRRLGTWDDEL